MVAKVRFSRLKHFSGLTVSRLLATVKCVFMVWRLSDGRPNDMCKMAAAEADLAKVRSRTMPAHPRPHPLLRR